MQGVSVACDMLLFEAELIASGLTHNPQPQPPNPRPSTQTSGLSSNRWQTMWHKNIQTFVRFKFENTQIFVRFKFEWCCSDGDVPASQAERAAPLQRAPPCRANTAHTRQSRPYSGPVFQVKVLKTFQVVPSPLGSGEPNT